MAQDYHYSVRVSRPEDAEAYLRYWNADAAQRTAAYAAQMQAAADVYARDLTGAYDTARQAVAAQADAQRAAAETSYAAMLDANEVQQLVNQRLVEERLSNLGLRQSGLNATNQTALAVGRGNADAAVRAQRQQALDEIAQEQYAAQTALYRQQQEAAADAAYETEQKIAAQAAADQKAANDKALSQYTAAQTADRQAASLQLQEQRRQQEAVDDWNMSLYKLLGTAHGAAQAELYMGQFRRLDESGSLVPLYKQTADGRWVLA